MSPPIAAGAGPDWKDVFEIAVASMVAGLTRGYSWTDPASGKYSSQQLVRALATSMTIGIITGALMQYANLPLLLAAALGSIISLVGLPFFITLIEGSVRMIWNAATMWFVSIRFPSSKPPGETSNATKPDAPSDKP